MAWRLYEKEPPKSLHKVVKLKNVEAILEILLVMGMQPDLVDWKGQSMLHLAAKEACTALCWLLLESGADPLLLSKAGAARCILLPKATSRGDCSLTGAQLKKKNVSASTSFRGLSACAILRPP